MFVINFSEFFSTAILFSKQMKIAILYKETNNIEIEHSTA
jgi:hypothetical protein